ncbi:hypothetical protein Hdeb2414_s0006g00210281 [Helianthus debilis subsp. tardiflorus]
MASQNSSSQFLQQQVVTTIFFYPLSPQFKVVVLLNSSTTQAYNPPGKPPIQLPTLILGFGEVIYRLMNGSPNAPVTADLCFSPTHKSMGSISK